MKFKIGDKVKYKDEYIKGCDIHNVFIVEQSNSYDYYYLVSDINDSSKKYLIAEEDLELINESTLKYNTLKYNKPSKEELFNMPKGTKIFTDAKKDNEFVYNGNTFCSENTLLYPSYLKYDLTINPTRKDKYGTRITKIEKPTYETVYENDFITDLIKDIKYYYEENDWLLRKNKALEEIVAELQEKLKQANIDIDISKQESNIADIFFNEED